MHEETGTHDGAVHGNQREENAQRSIERGRETLHNHFHQLHDAGDDGNEDDERKEGKVHAHFRVLKDLGLKQIVGGNGDDQNEDDCHAETEGSLDVLRHSQIGAHSQEKGEYHVVHENGADKKT